jgi:TIR domain
MGKAANEPRERAEVQSIIQGKSATNDFDVFLCHNAMDKPEVRKIREQLKERGILPWLDEWELRPGVPWQRLLEQQIENIKSAAVFVGKDGVGSWQQQELDSFLRQFVERGCPVIPVILSDVPQELSPKLPSFLENMTWVDFRRNDQDPIDQLIWGITGERGAS